MQRWTSDEVENACCKLSAQMKLVGFVKHASPFAITAWGPHINVAKCRIQSAVLRKADYCTWRADTALAGDV